MKVKELIEALSKVDPELEVFQADINNSSHVWGVSNVREDVSFGQFPDDYDMPEGFEYVRLLS